MTEPLSLFIDTNVLLSFYHLSSDDLEELRKLAVLLKNKHVSMLVPQQVCDEFKRNREVKIADALKRLRDQRLSLQFPQLCKDYAQYDELRRHQQGYEQKHAELLDRLSADIQATNLKADVIISELFTHATTIDIDDALIARARLRYERGNPPGKDGSLGDAITWEALLRHVPSGEPLYFVSDDKDYCSPLDESQFSTFLTDEWSETKGGPVVFYKRLSTFFKERFPHIRLASELEKDLLIRDLAASSTFQRTHAVVAKLSRFSDFTAAQANDIVDAATSNNQVYWIIGDDDVRDFLSNVGEKYSEHIKPESLHTLRELLRGDETEPATAADTQHEDDDLPFLSARPRCRDEWD